MTLHMYCLKNRLSGIFERPICERYEPSEYGELLTQSLSSAPVEQVEFHKQFDLYHIGCFDSKSGELSFDKVEFVMSLESLCNAIVLAKAEGDKNGKEASA